MGYCKSYSNRDPDSRPDEHTILKGQKMEDKKKALRVAMTMPPSNHKPKKPAPRMEGRGK